MITKIKPSTKPSSSPFGISIKNLTDEKFYNVKIFNNDHEKQNKISYFNVIQDGIAGYNRFLRQLQYETGQYFFNKIRLHSICDYKKFESKQLNSGMSVIHTDSNGASLSMPQETFIDPFQMQSGIVEKKNLNIEFSSTLQLELPFLMPETEVLIYLFPELKEIKKTDNKK